MFEEMEETKEGEDPLGRILRFWRIFSFFVILRKFYSYIQMSIFTKIYRYKESEREYSWYYKKREFYSYFQELIRKHQNKSPC